MLTIAIPTYNRPEQLRRCLEALAPQLNERCQLYISDNHSPKAVADIVKSVLGSTSFTNYKVQRHPANMGAIGNVLHCLQASETDWLWLLGDDDIVRDGAVRDVLSRISSSSNCLSVVFEVTEFSAFLDPSRSRKDVVVTDLESFLRSDALCCVSLISSAIYNMERLRPHLQMGYVFGSSYFPHLAILLEAMQRKRGEILYVSQSVVNFIGDGASETPPAHIQANFRHLTRMLEFDEHRAALMSGPFARESLKSRYLLPPRPLHLILAAAFRQTVPGRNVIRRARRVCAESIEFNNISSAAPLHGLMLMTRVMVCILTGLLLAWPLRRLYQIRTRGSRSYPPAFDLYRPLLLP